MKTERLVLGALDTNCYIFYDENTKNAVLIDPAADGDTIISKIKQLGITVKYIIITPAHIDHIMALDEIAEFTKAPVVIHSDDKDTLNNDAFNLAVYFHTVSPKTKADIIVKNGDTLDLDGHEIKFIHTPGHNKGSMCILCGDTLFSGDTLFLMSVGRTDHYGGNQEKIIKSIKTRLFVLDENIRVYPGHGDPTTIGYEIENNMFVR